MDATKGSGTLVPTATNHLKMLLNLVKQSSHDDRTRRRLAAVTADTAMQTGWYTFDGGAHAEGQRFFLAALRAAHASGDPRLRAGALAFLAIHAYSVGDPRDAVTAALAARQSIGMHDAPALHAMLATRQARGHARLREARQAEAALDEARSLCAEGRGEHDPHWLYWINPGEILGQTGSCYLELGQPAKAAVAFKSARSCLNRKEARTHAQFLSRAATAQLQAGDVDGGCVIGQEVLTLAEDIRSARLDEHLRSMLAQACQSDSLPSRELVERGTASLTERVAS
ncbi:hypothetical protein [Streptomyces zagrosensis]|uniref:Tetratricopeptide (TPR) repeat protein n=1 Tax=Streptomyces zagrosensis TaxID=1042984 RepID=A0A7W9UZN5_9ACTN|nr:hypothetical protein [Streptomyces zagrosensis]MBB5937233.1 tetratricopeptide (TPR) repeat protein [Streptomyces zagrosensis]